MAATQSFAQVVQTFVDQDNKAERRSLTLLLGTISQRLSDDFSANCRSLGETRDRAESHMSLVMAVRTLWATTPELLFTSADPNYERLAQTAIEHLGEPAADRSLVRDLSMVYRRLLGAQRYGRGYLTNLDLSTVRHRRLLEEQLGRCALCRYMFLDSDVETVDYEEEAIEPPREAYAKELTLSRYNRTPVLDHVIPQFLGGDGQENWQILCGSCNSGKGEGLSWILRRGLLPPARPSDAFKLTPSLRHAVLSNCMAMPELQQSSPESTGELRIFRKDVARLPVFDNLHCKAERLLQV